MNIRQNYLPFGRPNFSSDEIEAVVHVMQSGWIGMGAETIAFEKELAEYVGSPYVVAVNSCTSALFLALLSLGVGPGDEVICPSLTWCSTANAANYCGATPVFCDVDRQTFSVTAETIVAAVTSRTKAVMVVHYGGLAVDVTALRLALPDHVAIVEDAAHALGSVYPNGLPVGSSGNLVCYSFYANKNLSTGDGGAIAVPTSECCQHLQSLSRQGLSSDAWKRFTHPQAALVPGISELGYKMNFTDLLACIGRVQLKRQDEFHATRLMIANRYHERISLSGLDIGFQDGAISVGHARHLFVVTLPIEDMSLSRNEVVLELRSKNIGASIHYAPLHSMPLFSQTPRVDLAVTDYLSRRIITLPIGVCMTLDDADYVIDNLLQILTDRKFA